MTPQHLLAAATLALSLGCTLATPLPAAAQAAPAATAAPADMTEGEVRKVDKDTGRLTLKHGEIKNLEMPPMTMVFHVKDKAWLDSLKPGDKLKFKAVSEGGKYTVTELQPLK